MDTGPTLAQRETGIDPEETAGDLESRLASLGADLLIEVLPPTSEGHHTLRSAQRGRDVDATHSRISGAFGLTAPAAVLHNQVRAFSPTPGAYTSRNGSRLKVLRSRATEGLGP